MLSRNAILMTLGLVLLVAITSWLTIKTEHLPSNNNTQSGLPEIIASNIQIQQINKQGHVSYQLKAESATEYQDEHYALKNISSKLYAQGGPPWHLTANQGQVINNNAEIQLSGKVTATRAANQKTPALAFDTPELTIYPNSKIAVTSSRVNFTEVGTGNTMTAIGMHASLNNQTLKLLSNVESYYVPVKAHS